MHVYKLNSLFINFKISPKFDANLYALYKGIPKLCKPHTDIFSKNGGGLPLYWITKAGSDGGNL